MRLAPTFAVSSWLLVLLGIGLDLGTCHAQAKDSFDDDPPGTTEYVKEFAPILGRGINLKDAEQDALRKAKRLLDEFLRTLEPRLEWSPSLAYIQQALLKGAPERQESKDETVSGVEVKC